MNPDLDTLVTSHPLELTIWHLAPGTWHLFRLYSITGNPRSRYRQRSVRRPRTTDTAYSGPMRTDR